jgi:dTDP-4-dehydrorhamnose 3,5-epimerase-like enzyme
MPKNYKHITMDERGFFARTWCGKEFEAHGLGREMVQENSLSIKKGAQVLFWMK